MGACKLMNKMAISKSAVTNAIAQCTTRRRKTTISEAMISRLARTKKMAVAAFMKSYWAATMITAVTATLSKAKGSIIFHPRRMT
jgi:hypothetical protein